MWGQLESQIPFSFVSINLLVLSWSDSFSAFLWFQALQDAILGTQTRIRSLNFVLTHPKEAAAIDLDAQQDEPPMIPSFEFDLPSTAQNNPNRAAISTPNPEEIKSENTAPSADPASASDSCHHQSHSLLLLPPPLLRFLFPLLHRRRHHLLFFLLLLLSFLFVTSW